MPPPALLPPGTPDEVVERAKRAPRVPVFDPRVGRGPVPASGGAEQRLVVLGDSLSHGFQSGAIFNTVAVVSGADRPRARLSTSFRYPVYDGPGDGLPINLEFLLRDLEHRFGAAVDWWELPGALARVRELMDAIEDHWERGAGRVAPGRAADQPRAGHVRLEPARPGDPHRDQPGGRDQAAERRPDQPARLQPQPARGAARLSALRRPDPGDDAGRRRAGRSAPTAASRPWSCSSAPTTRSARSPT